MSSRLEIIKTKSSNLFGERNTLVNNCINSLIQNQQVLNEMIKTTNGYQNADNELMEFNISKQNLINSTVQYDYIDKKLISNNNNNTAIGKELFNDENTVPSVKINNVIPIISIDKFNAIPINIRGKLKYIQVKNMYDKVVSLNKKKNITSSDIESMNVGVKTLPNEYLIPIFRALGICK